MIRVNHAKYSIKRKNYVFKISNFHPLWFMVFHKTSGENFKEWEEPSLKIKLGSIPVYFTDWFKNKSLFRRFISFKGHIRIQAFSYSRGFTCVSFETKEKIKSEY